jgi:protein-S-isoprenylcysteine O-methyltransferase Ste14
MTDDSTKTPKAKAAPKSKPKATSAKKTTTKASTAKKAPTKKAPAKKTKNEAPKVETVIETVKVEAASVETPAAQPSSSTPESAPKGAAAAQDTPNIPMLPPTLVLLHVVAGIVLGWVLPISLSHSWGYVGLLLVGGAIGVAYHAKDTIEKAGSNLAPNLPTTKLVKDGPYAYSRNPVYLAFLVGFVGLALLAGSFAMLLVTGSLYYFLRHKVIAAEEAYLEEKFGNAYREYTMQVHRWVMFSK